MAHIHRANPITIKILYRIPKLRFLSPGWFVTKLTKREKLQKQLEILDNIELTDEEIMRIKQFFCHLSFIFFFSYILLTGLFLKGILLNFAMDAVICLAPEVIFERIIRLKRQRMEVRIPDFMDSLTMAIESGMNFINAFEYVSDRTKMELGEEALRTKKAIAFGIDQDTALDTMASRLGAEDFFKFIGSIKQAKRLGVSIAETLKIQSDLIKTRRRQKAEELSRSASVKMSIPLVFCIFPALLIVYLVPGILRLVLE